jgi:hypothetical protein
MVRCQLTVEQQTSIFKYSNRQVPANSGQIEWPVFGEHLGTWISAMCHNLLDKISHNIARKYYHTRSDR